MIKLGVNIDHIATLRQARGTLYPDPVQAAFEVEKAGAEILTLHLREDRRHIQDRDVELIRSLLQIRMNLEMAVTDEMISIAGKVCPDDCCLVPEKREELTTEGGLDVVSQVSRVSDACSELAEAGIRVSLFVDPSKEQIEACKKTGAPCVEIHTGAYADAINEEARILELKRIVSAVELADQLGLQANAGHGLNYHNVQEIAMIANIAELNIGHAIVARSVFVGLEQAIRSMKKIIDDVC
ncbi:pyridoxine 5'-phosphate synthase [Pseudomonadota bacterium]